MHVLSSRLITCAFILVSGCALSEIKAQNQQAQARIDTKTEQLAREQSTQRDLIDAQRGLLRRREEDQQRLSDLDARLDSLLRDNARIAAQTKAQEREKAAIEAQLRKYRAESTALSRDTSVSDAAKEARIEELKKQIDAYLKSIRPL
ncbi:MAG TPA: hypothetical protein VKK81_24000 [Candidatus Binatia bacterium]|nr:hypothetical protein [Candidatus Binatia bacterium]